MSSHGDSTSSGWSKVGVWKISSAQIICVHVVPHFGGVLMTMSSGRNAKPSQRALSKSSDLYVDELAVSQSSTVNGASA